jgi:hypothetical protein
MPDDVDLIVSVLACLEQMRAAYATEQRLT